MTLPAALQIWSPTFSRAFDALPTEMREAVERKVDEMGTRMDGFPHKRLTGRAEFRLRVGDYRVLYDFDLKLGRIYLHYAVTGGKYIRSRDTGLFVQLVLAGGRWRRPGLNQCQGRPEWIATSYSLVKARSGAS